MELAGGAEGKAVATTGPLTPDQVVYCKSFPMWSEPGPEAQAGGIVERLREEIQEHTRKTGPPPQVILVKGLGMFAVGDDFAAPIRCAWFTPTRSR